MSAPSSARRRTCRLSSSRPWHRRAHRHLLARRRRLRAADGHGAVRRNDAAGAGDDAQGQGAAATAIGAKRPAQPGSSAWCFAAWRKTPTSVSRKSKRWRRNCGAPHEPNCRAPASERRCGHRRRPVERAAGRWNSRSESERPAGRRHGAALLRSLLQARGGRRAGWERAALAIRFGVLPQTEVIRKMIDYREDAVSGSARRAPRCGQARRRAISLTLTLKTADCRLKIDGLTIDNCRLASYFDPGGGSILSVASEVSPSRPCGALPSFARPQRSLSARATPGSDPGRPQSSRGLRRPAAAASPSIRRLLRPRHLSLK